MPRPFPIVQFPNRPLIATVLAAAIARGTGGRTSLAARVVSLLALLVWSAEEIVDGANWFRRLLGVCGAAWGIAGLARGLPSSVSDSDTRRSLLGPRTPTHRPR